ncbi:hypothetical protein CC78DRAFT_604746 [Lojkania enalia]|uniref:Zn(2)-C6 fungal-type domain-containing protein n=1 Tax=Lojkania enalia TaxID=147567 RepID=A0A9P4K6Z8_9PLEO|nr:hypothetical protein CC78DRAFT_604746 [Didymosphaeria enalia]
MAVRISKLPLPGMDGYDDSDESDQDDIPEDVNMEAVDQTQTQSNDQLKNDSLSNADDILERAVHTVTPKNRDSMEDATCFKLRFGDYQGHETVSHEPLFGDPSENAATANMTDTHSDRAHNEWEMNNGNTEQPTIITDSLFKDPFSGFPSKTFDSFKTTTGLRLDLDHTQEKEDRRNAGLDSLLHETEDFATRAQANGAQASAEGIFRTGFSDDEEGVETFDRSFPDAKEKTCLSRSDLTISIKSPQREDRAEIEGLRMSERIRNTLFGGPVNQSDDGTEEEDRDEDEDGIPRVLRNKILSLDSTPTNSQHEGHPQGQRSSSLGLGHSGFESGLVRESPLPPALESLTGADASLFQQRGDGEVGHPRPGNSNCFWEHSSPTQIPYGLRRNIDRQVATTYLDVDKSGDYDPRDARKKKKVMPKMKGKGKTPKKRVRKLIVRLSFERIGNVINATDGEENWPEDWSELDSEQERELQKEEGEREKRKALYRQNTPGVEPQEPIPDPLSSTQPDDNRAVEDLAGHPAARGCYECRIRDVKCSVAEGGTWPCRHCFDNDIDCRLIIEPRKKGQCKRCREIGEECSFQSDEEPHAMCRQCFDAEFPHCEAGPPKGYKHDRIDLDTIMYGPNRLWTHCTHCRIQKKMCSLKWKVDRPPCKQCKRGKLACTFYDLDKVDQGKMAEMSRQTHKPKSKARAQQGRIEASKRFNPFYLQEGGEVARKAYETFYSDADVAFLEADKDNDEEERLREATPEVEMTDAEGRRGVLTKIMTSFSYPIIFHTTTPRNGASDCNFCQDVIFGMWGYGEKKVHVIRWHNGLGYSEVAGGHREENEEGTSMCADCTMSRLQVILCPNHELTRYASRGQEEDLDSIADALRVAKPRSAEMRHGIQKFCSMCVKVASFGCCTPQPSLSTTRDSEDGALIPGCGLRLCEDCVEKLRKDFQGDSHAMAAAVDSESKTKFEDGKPVASIGDIRADVGFLTTNGLLMKNVEAIVGGDEDQEMETEI